METEFLSASQSQTIQDIADTVESEVVQQHAQILLLLNQGATPDQLSVQFNFAAEEIENLFQSFIEQGIDIFPGLSIPTQVTQGEASDIDELVDKFKKAKTPGIHTEDQISEAGRKILGFYFTRMVQHEPGTRLGEDVEALHDMRVATRRMRVALEVFGPFFKDKVIKSHLKGLRSTARALGTVRDLDVFSGKLNDYLESLPEDERLGFGVFLSQWRGKHNKAKTKMIRFLDSNQYQLFTRQFGRFLNTPDAGSRKSKTVHPNQVRDLAPIMIYERLAVVRAYEQVLGNATIEELHSLRIQLKKLRYVIEFFRDVLGAESKEVIQTIKVLQDHLGNLNDADVACQTVNGFITRLEKKQVGLPIHERVNPESIFVYLAAKYDERHRLIATFRDPWQTIMGSAFSENLAKAISVI